MRLVSYRTAAGESSVGIVTEEGVVDAAGAIAVPASAGLSPMRRLLLGADGTGVDAATLAETLAGVSGTAVPLSELQVEPIVPDPGKIMAAPVNYFDHKAEMNEDAHVDSLGLFLKAPTSVLAAAGEVRLPYTDRRFDQEGELAVVIGRTASHVSASDALEYIAGYTLLLDMTMRGGEDRSTRKSFDTFTPVGPFLVTPDEAGSPQDMRLRCWVGDELRQDADIADLIWGVPELIAYASSVMVLKPGDILTTGTPAGVGVVGDGDRVAVEVGGLGRLEVWVSDVGAVACPTKGADRGPRPPATVTPVRVRDDEGGTGVDEVGAAEVS
jgi:2-keto-4-pentenoate hydratase/2-oxohepta-3-ene-1,7-dioic acid hydratase in catechol pathway